MSSEIKGTHDSHANHGPTFSGYILGFGLSLALTLTAYFAVANHWTSGGALVALIVVLAMTQLIVQLLFFLHLGQENKPRWNLTTFWFAVIVLVIVVAGSLWIMKNLNYHSHTMSPEQTDQEIIKDEGYKPRSSGHHHVEN